MADDPRQRMAEQMAGNAFDDQRPAWRQHANAWAGALDHWTLGIPSTVSGLMPWNTMADAKSASADAQSDFKRLYHRDMLAFPEAVAPSPIRRQMPTQDVRIATRMEQARPYQSPGHIPDFIQREMQRLPHATRNDPMSAVSPSYSPYPSSNDMGTMKVAPSRKNYEDWARKSGHEPNDYQYHAYQQNMMNPPPVPFPPRPLR